MSFPPRYRAKSRVDLSAVHTGQERGEIAADAPVGTVMRTTIAVIDGLQQHSLLELGEVSMAAGFEAFTETLRARWRRDGCG